MDPSQLVATFNTLPRRPLAPSGSVANHWHISVRHVPLNPPGDVLFILNPAARYVHVEGPLPASAANAPMSVKAATSALLLLKAFNNALGNEGMDEARLRPWIWACNDAELAGALGETLRTMGITAPEGVSVAEEGDNTIADEEWGRYIGKLQDMMGATSQPGTPY